ncbi:MAG: hypothetical protein R2712_08850 [Vicinamibacterales bacterium]
MTALTDRRVVPHRRLAAWDVVRVVTGRAGERALLEARGFRQPVRGTRDLELVRMRAALVRRRRVVEVQTASESGVPGT